MGETKPRPEVEIRSIDLAHGQGERFVVTAPIAVMATVADDPGQ